MALREVELRDWWRVARRELPSGLMLGAILGIIGMARISAWQWMFDHHIWLGYNYNPHWQLIALTVGVSLVGIVTFGSLAGSMLPFLLRRGRVRSGVGFGATRCHARGRDGAEHLFPGGDHHSPRYVVVARHRQTQEIGNGWTD